MEDYEVEPNLPGISPTGKTVPAFVEVSPYIPEGSGYKALRKKPGFSKVHDKVAKNTNIAEYGPEYYRSAEYKRLSQDPGSKPYSLDTVNMLKEKTGVKGYYDPSSNTTLVPKRTNLNNDLSNTDSVATRRHEFTHRMQPKKGTMLGKELDANIAQTKSIRKGLDKTANAYSDYLLDRASNQLASGESPKKVAADLERGKVANTVLQKVNSAAKKIPTKPGMMTGKVPTFRGLGGGMLDMFFFPALNDVTGQSGQSYDPLKHGG